MVVKLIPILGFAYRLFAKRPTTIAAATNKSIRSPALISLCNCYILKTSTQSVGLLEPLGNLGRCYQDDRTSERLALVPQR